MIMCERIKDFHALGAAGVIAINPGKVAHWGGGSPIWGTADPEESITVMLTKKSLLSGSAMATGTKADKDGRWKVNLSLNQDMIGGPYELTIKGKNTITLKNVLVGEVWICSGIGRAKFDALCLRTG